MKLDVTPEELNLITHALKVYEDACRMRALEAGKETTNLYDADESECLESADESKALLAKLNDQYRHFVFNAETTH